MKVRFLLLLTATVISTPAHTEPCVDGVSQGAACSHIDALGHLTPAQLGGSGEVLNDIWGWVDDGGEEYAIVGMQDGTAFVRLATDGTPLFLGRLPASDGESLISKQARPGKSCHDELCGSEDSAWRDVKVFGHHAYIVSEAVRHGLQIFDLHDLRTLDPAAPDLELEAAGFYEGIGHAHNIFINEDSARAYVVGHDNPGVAGGLHVLDISTDERQVAPILLAELSDDGYTHDVQCVNYAGPDPDIAPESELCFASNEDTLTVWDVTDPQNAEVLSRTGYSESAYTHQGWLSPNHEYFYLNDELDEQHTRSRTHLRVFDVRDVDAPQIAAHYYAPTLAIDHNNYAYGRWLYQSNYTAGLRILDVLDPTAPVEAAYFDPQSSDNAVFAGTWSNFVFPSGRIAFTDIQNGLYIVQPTISEATAAPDLTVELQLDATDAEIGELIDGSMTLSSDAAADASDVLVTLHLPVNASFIEVVEPQGWTCTPGSDGRVVECRVAMFAADQEANFEFSMTSSVGGDVETIAMAYANEADAAPADNLDAATANFAAAVAPASPDSGGGGGSTGWPLTAVLLLAGLRMRRFRR